MPDFSTTDVAAQVRPVNAFAQLGDMANTINALNQNKLFRAKQLSGQYLTQSTGPDGKVDPDKLNRFLMNDPRTAPFAADIEASALQNTGLAIQNVTNQQAQNQTKYNAALALGAQSKDDADWMAALNSGVKAGLFDQDFASNVAGGNIQGLDSASVAAARRRAQLAASNPVEVGANFGQPSVQDLGGNLTTINTRVTPEGPVVTQATGDAAVLPKGLPPTSRNTIAYSYWDPGKGQMIQVTQGQVADAQASGQPLPGGGPGSQGIAGGPPLGAAETAGANVQQATTAQAYAQDAPQRIAVLQNMRDQVTQFTPGPNAPAMKRLEEWAQEWGLPIQVDPNAVSAQEEFSKFAVQALRSQMAQLGLSGTDAQTTMAEGATPNETLSKGGILRITGILQGNEELLKTRNDLWQKYQQTHGPASWGQFISEFNKVADPRVFQAAHMTPQELAQMEKGMTPQQRTLFQQRIQAAKNAGYINAGQ